MSQLGAVILFTNEAKNAGIAVATASIFNKISGQKDKHSGSCYLRFITYYYFVTLKADILHYAPLELFVTFYLSLLPIFCPDGAVLSTSKGPAGPKCW